MVNTVGSYTTKYWHKDLILAKEKMFLTQEQQMKLNFLSQ